MIRSLLYGRFPLPRVGAALLVVAMAAPVLVGAQQQDDFFDSDLDGSWVGTLKVKKQHFLLQLNLNLEDSANVGFLIIPDAESGETPVFEATVSSTSATSVEFSIDEDTPLSRMAAVSTFALDYDAATDTLSGRVSGDLKGTVELVRMDPDVPLQRLWSGTSKIDGKNEVVLFFFTQAPSGGSRFAGSTVGGRAWVAGEEGTVDGELNGAKLTATVDLPGKDDLDMTVSLKKKNNLLKGKGTLGASKPKFKLVPAAGSGKKIKFKSITPNTAAAGATTTITLNGKNLNLGANVYSDNPSVRISSVVRTSAKALRVDITPDAGVADGTTVGLRLVNADGQTADKRNILTISNDDGGGGGTTVSFANDVQPIFTTNCALAGCHNAATAQQGLVLEAGSAFSNIVNVPSSEQPSVFRVSPGDADASYLVRKIRGTSGISGGRMPLNRTPLSAAQIDTIATWVNEGAADNRESQ